MSDHYSGNDPLLGCGLMVLSAVAVIGGLVLLVALVVGGVL